MEMVVQIWLGECISKTSHLCQSKLSPAQNHKSVILCPNECLCPKPFTCFEQILFCIKIRLLILRKTWGWGYSWLQLAKSEISTLVTNVTNILLFCSHPSVLTSGSLFLSSSLSSARSVLKPFSWEALYSGLKTSSSLRLTKHAVWYQRSIRPSWGFSGSMVFFDTRIWS